MENKKAETALGEKNTASPETVQTTYVCLLLYKL